MERERKTKVKCCKCGIWKDYPEEWEDLREETQEILEDDFICNNCWKKTD